MLKTRWILLILCAAGSLAATSPSDEIPVEVRSFLQQAQAVKLPLPEHRDLFNNYYEVSPAPLLARAPASAPEDLAVVFLPGMGEPALKYYELVKDLAPLHAKIYLWDHLGQGLSSHLLPQQQEKVFIKDFGLHVEALTNFLLTLRPRHKRIFVIGHSMGGHLALRAALNKPDLIDGLALSSPLVGFETETWWVKLAQWMLPYFPETDSPPFYFLFKKVAESGTNVTHDEKRMAIYRRTTSALPAIKRTGPTIGWLRAATASIEELSKADLSALKFPVLLMQAEDERLVSNRAQRELCEKLPHCRLEVVKGSRHEILFETDPMRSTALHMVLEAARAKN